MSNSLKKKCVFYAEEVKEEEKTEFDSFQESLPKFPFSKLTPMQQAKMIFLELCKNDYTQFRVFKDLDRMYKTKVTARGFKVASKETKGNRVVTIKEDGIKTKVKRSELYLMAKNKVEAIENPLAVNHLEDTRVVLRDTIIKYIESSKTSRDKILSDYDNPESLHKFFVLAGYSYGECYYDRFKDLHFSKNLEVYILNKRRSRKTIREIFKNHEWEEACSMFRNFIQAKQLMHFDDEVIKELAKEEEMYKRIDRDEIRMALYELIESVRLDISGQQRLFPQFDRYKKTLEKQEEYLLELDKKYKKKDEE